MGFFLRRRSCVFFLSSCSMWGRLLLSLFWCDFCASSWGACGFPWRVLPLVTLSGFRNLSGSSSLAYSCSGDLLLGWRCLWCTTWFSTLCRALPPGPVVCATSPAAAYPWGVFCLFGHRVPDLLLLWWRGLGGNPSLIFLCFACAGWLAGVCWALHPVSGSSRWGYVCSLGDSVMTLLAFPYLRVGVLLAWGVYDVSCCEVCSLGCPSWLVLLFDVCVCPSPALGLGWFGHRSVAPPAAPMCWALLASRLRRCFFSPGVFFLGRLLGLGLVGCGPPGFLPSFGGTLLPLAWFSLGSSCSWLSRLLVFS